MSSRRPKTPEAEQNQKKSRERSDCTKALERIHRRLDDLRVKEEIEDAHLPIVDAMEAVERALYRLSDKWKVVLDGREEE